MIRCHATSDNLKENMKMWKFKQHPRWWPCLALPRLGICKDLAKIVRRKPYQHPLAFITPFTKFCIKASFCTNKRRHFMTPYLRQRTDLTCWRNWIRFGILKPFHKIRRSRRSVKWLQAIQKKCCCQSLSSQSPSQHQTVNISDWNITKKKEAGHVELPQIVSDHIAFSRQGPAAIVCTFQHLQYRQRLLDLWENKQNKWFSKLCRHLT